MKLDDVLNKVSTIGAIGRREDAERAIAATVSVLAECLDDEDALAVANDLPRPLRQLILTGRHGVVHDESELYERVCVREGAPPGFSREHAQAACEVIGSLLSLETRRRLEIHLPPAIVDLLRPVNRDPEPPPYSSRDPRHNVLATGSGDSMFPVSSAAPRDAHAHSVARDADPHGDTKLSGAHGTTQEALAETLAEGHPGPRRPISEG